jgi:cytochrome c556
MNRKWPALAVTMVTAALVVTTFAIADDEESPLKKLMEKVQAKNTVITKGVRNKVNYTKSQKQVAAAADDLVKLSKEAKSLLNDESRKVAKGKGVAKPDDEWVTKIDAFTKEAEVFAKLVGDTGTTAEKAKDGFKPVAASCTACHDVFRSEE